MDDLGGVDLDNGAIYHKETKVIYYIMWHFIRLNNINMNIFIIISFT